MISTDLVVYSSQKNLFIRRALQLISQATPGSGCMKLLDAKIWNQGNSLIVPSLSLTEPIQGLAVIMRTFIPSNVLNYLVFPLSARIYKQTSNGTYYQLSVVRGTKLVV